MAKIHELKTWPDPYRGIEQGHKTAEFRENDRLFNTLDYLYLREWAPDVGQYTGSALMARVTHVLRGPDFGVPDGYVVLSIRVLR